VGLLLRGKQARRSASPAALRLSLASHGGGLEIGILKQRGGLPGCPVRLAAETLFSREAASLPAPRFDT